MYNAPAIPPRGECRSNNDVFRELAGRLGFEPELFPDDETLIREVLSGGQTLEGITLERLRERGARSLEHSGSIHPVCRGSFSHAFRKVRALFRANEGRRLRPAACLHSAAAKTRSPVPTWLHVIRCNWSAPRARSSSIRRLPIHPAIALQPAIRRSSWPPRMPRSAA